MTHRAIRRTLLVALATCCAALAPFAGHHLDAGPAFTPACLTAVIMADLLIAALLVSQFLARGSAQLLGLACAFLLAGLLAVTHALLLPGGLTARGLLGADALAPSWLWAIWHGALPLSLAAALWGGPPDTRRALADPAAPRRRLAAGACVAVAGSVAIIVWTLVALDGSLPALTDGRGLTPLSRTVGPVVVLADLLALVALVRRGRRTDLERRLLLVGACSLAGTVLALVAGQRLAVGWYAAEALELLAVSIVLVTLLSDGGPLGLRGARGAGAVDPLTGALTRAATVATLERLHRGRSRQEPLTLALVDVDRLHAIDDAHGPLAADAILLTVAERLRAQLRDQDVLGRAGDEGFLLILPATDAEGATLAVDRAVRAVRETPVGTWAHDVRATVSAGIATVGAGDGATADALAEADLALNQAKANGRDQVVTPARATVVSLRRAGAGSRPG